MNYSNNYRILILDRGIILGYRSTEKQAVELALQQADRLKASIEVFMADQEQLDILKQEVQIAYGFSRKIW